MSPADTVAELAKAGNLVTSPFKRRHGGTLRVDLPHTGDSTLRERAEICLRALAISEGLHGCEGGASDEPCCFPACIASGCPGGEDKA